MPQNLFSGIEGPFGATPSSTQVRAAMFSGFSNFVQRLHSSPRQIVEFAGIDPAALHDSDIYIEVQSFVDVLERCAMRFNNPLFGLQFASNQKPDIFGCIAVICRAAPTVKDALTLFGKYIPIMHAPSVTVEILQGKEVAELRYAPLADYGIFDQSNYHSALLLTSLLREIGGPHFLINSVSLNTHTRSQDLCEVEKLFGCRFHSSPINAISFPKRLLDMRVASHDRLLLRVLGDYLERVEAMSRTTVVERVEDYIRGFLPSGRCTIGHCAKKLGLSERSLHDHLGGYGVRFSELLEKQRIEFAKTYLEEMTLSLDEIAFRLGYAEQSSFGRAFKRWTNITPKRFQLEATRNRA